VVKAATVPLADSTKERRCFLVKVILENVKRYEQLMWLRIVQAEEILAKIERGEPVEYENVITSGRYSLASIKVRYDSFTYPRKTPTWQLSTFPRLPLY